MTKFWKKLGSKFIKINVQVLKDEGPHFERQISDQNFERWGSKFWKFEQIIANLWNKDKNGETDSAAGYSAMGQSSGPGPGNHPGPYR